MSKSRYLVLAALCLSVAAGAAGTLTTATAASAAFGRGTPAFVVSAAPKDVDKVPRNNGTVPANVDVAGEPSIGIDWKTGAALFQSWSSTYKVTFNNKPSVPTVTWSDVTAPFATINLDPILATDSATGTTIAGGDTLACDAMAITQDDGGLWLPTVPCPIAYDHPTVGVGPAAAGLPTVGGEVAYYCQATGVDICARSLDGGQSWSLGEPDPNRICQNGHGHVKIALDGMAYVPSNHCTDTKGNPTVGAFVSRDNGLTWSGFGIPGAPSPSSGFDPSLGIDTSGRVYESWSRAGDRHPVITWSSDHGKTWAPQVDLAGTVSPKLAAGTFQAVVAGAPGRAAVAFLGSSDPLRGMDPYASLYVGHWHLYIAFTYDGGAHWQTVRATSDPVQIGEIDSLGTTTGGQRNLHDFMDAGLTRDGRVVVGFADGCLPGCKTVAQSQHQWATVAYQSAGRGLCPDGPLPKAVGSTRLAICQRS